uniref:AAA domain-containing protein, putative AbiEii toxin, Type IV TA system n=1 Tax=Candidatus Kentrum sp. UNK TaxID=2126344 RepID=A0A451AES9_9GAMM|nr:MAG: AAA domain-containing protein, putative AbiEii toxin, Type IV TA system [Candidatus Kentron sp. UNK]VFK71123.1 MAG: AAA domain-containing protein, putative AbiEii toxin, Type IV TA system [Candidatus Kentron sp. UNK]
MNGTGFQVRAMQPLFLTVEGIGPFQEKPFELDFTDANDEPCNFYVLVSENGRGKSILLDLMACLMGLLSGGERERLEFEDLDSGKGRAQWDLLVELHREGREERIVLSLAAGGGDPWSLAGWDNNRLETYGATERVRLGYRRHDSSRLELVGINDERVRDLVAAVRGWQGSSPDGFENNTLTLPTLLYFDPYRDIPSVSTGIRGINEPAHWGYHPVHRFGHEGENWQDSLDNLLVWLKWLDDERFDRAVKIINERVFAGSTKFLKGIRKEPPEAIVNNEGHIHRLDRLSSGEKSLVQLYLRLGVHMTRNTILIVDEMDVHLHAKWQHRTMRLFKQLLRENPGLTIIATHHSVELIEAFSFEVPQEGLRKGGFIINENLE